jgi:hypothetical protein
VFGPLGTLQNVAVISSIQITPVVGFWLPDRCWPFVVTPVAAPAAVPRALAALLVAPWLFAAAFVGEVCACTFGGANTSDSKTSAAIKTSLFMGATLSAGHRCAPEDCPNRSVVFRSGLRDYSIGKRFPPGFDPGGTGLLEYQAACAPEQRLVTTG